MEYKSNSKIKANNNNNYINDYNYNNNLINEINYFNSQSKSKEKAIDQNQFKGKSKSIDDYMYMYDLQDIVNNERIIIMSIQLSGEKEEDNIIEICCIEMIDRKKTKNKFHSFFRPRNEMTVDLKEKYKIPEEVFKYNSRKLQLLYKELLDFIGESLIFIYNVNDELGKINKELQYYKLTSIKKYQCIDIQTIFFKKYSYLTNKLSDCCDYLKMRCTKKNLNSAEYKTSLLFKIIRRIYIIKDSNNNYAGDDDDEMDIEEEENTDKNDMEERSGKMVTDVVIKKYRVVENFLNKKRNEN